MFWFLRMRRGGKIDVEPETDKQPQFGGEGLHHLVATKLRLQHLVADAEAKAIAAAKAAAEAESARLAFEEAAAAARLEAVMAKKAEGEKLMADGHYTEASVAFADAMSLPDGHLVADLPGLKEEAERMQADVEEKDREAAEAVAAAKAEEEAAANREKVLQQVEEGKMQMQVEHFYKANKEFTQASQWPNALDICPELPLLIEESAYKDKEKKAQELRLIQRKVVPSW